MKSEAESGILVTARELEERLGRELEITDWRAVIAVVVVKPGLEHEADQACTTATRAAQLAPSQVVEVTVRRDGTSKEQLEAINRARDTLLQDKRLVWLRAASAADVRFLRKTAPDLMSAVDLFVELRPELEAEALSDWPTCREQLRALMEERHATLDFTGLLPASVEQRKLPLAELYQPLVESRPTDLGVIGHSAGVLVLGHPGTGKTTFVRHLAWVYARRLDDPLQIGDKVPLLLSLSDYGYEREHDRVSTLVDFLPRWLIEQGVEHAESLPAHLPDVLLLLDGLDEIRALEARRSVLLEVSRLLRDERIGGIVVTGRSFLVDELGQEDIVLRLASTREATHDEIRRFLDKFAELRRGSASNAADLVRRVERDDDLRALARTPLMLAFMAILDELEGRLPDRRIEIYYRLGEMLVDRWTRARSIGSSANRRERPSRGDALRVLGPLAWWTVEQGGGAVPEQALSAEIERIEARREAPEEATRRAAALLELLRSDTALLVPQAGRRWSFVHSSVGEYFAGVEAERDRKRWKDLLEDPFRPEWREIVIFCAGQLGVIEGKSESLDALVDAVLAKSRRKGRYDAKYPSLLMGLLKESPGLSLRQVEQLVDRLLELVLRMSYAPTAAFQMQTELTRFLFESRGPVAERIGISMRAWFSASAHEIWWDRLFNVAREAWSIEDLASMFAHVATINVLNDFAIGPIATTLVAWKDIYQVDINPTLKLWRQDSGWRYRMAEWHLIHGAAHLQRPFAEVVRELGLVEETKAIG